MRRAAVAAAVRHENVAAVAAAPPVPPPVVAAPPPVLPPGMETAIAAAQMAATVSQQVLSVMMLAMVATAVVSTVSMSAIAVKRAQEAATPTPAATLAALLAPPTLTPRPQVARRERAPPAVQQIVEESVSRSIQWAPSPPPAPMFTPEIGRRVPQTSLKYTSEGDHKNTPYSPSQFLPPPIVAPAPNQLAPPPMAEQAPLACNVTYTKTIRTITLEPTGNVTHVETFNYTIPCAEAPALPPAGAPDSAEPTVTRTTRTLPHAPAGQAGGPDAPDGVASPDGAPGPRADSTGAEAAAAAPTPGAAEADPLAALLAGDPSLAAQLAQLSPGEAPSGGPSKLAALLAANPALRALLPPAPGRAPPGGGNGGGDGPNPDDAKVSYDVWGRPVSDPEAERAADAAENAAPLDAARRDPAAAAAAREAEVVRLRAEQRAWWDAELAKARAQAQGHVARPVDFSRKPGEKDGSKEAHPVEHHVAVDMARERLRTDLDTEWNVADEIVSYRERMEWKNHFTIGRPARRFLREVAGASGRWRGWRRMLSALVRGVVRWWRSMPVRQHREGTLWRDAAAQ